MLLILESSMEVYARVGFIKMHSYDGDYPRGSKQKECCRRYDAEPALSARCFFKEQWQLRPSKVSPIPKR